MSKIKKFLGFTLIELTICVAVIGIIYGIVTYTFDIVDQKQLSNNMFQLEQYILDVKELSVLNNKSYEINFYVYDGLIFARSNDGREYLDMLTLDNGVIIYNINAKNNKILYSSKGLTGDACSIILRKNKYFQKLTIPVGGGAVTVHEITK